jgi:serine protease AprX
VTDWRKLLTGAVIATICVFGATAPAAAGSDRGGSGSNSGSGSGNSGPGKHAKLDPALTQRAKRGLGISRAIVTLNGVCDLSAAYAKVGGKKGAHFTTINSDLVELPNVALVKIAEHPCVNGLHWDRPVRGHMSFASVVSGARAVQQSYGYDGAGVGVAVIDSGITGWHNDLTYLGTNPQVKVISGQRVSKFVDFVNGHTSAYDDNGHGTHVAGIIGGNGVDSGGPRKGIAPASNIISLKVLNGLGSGSISHVIAAFDWAVTNRVANNIRVINVSVGASVSESYKTDPLCLAAKRAVDVGIVVVAAAGNLGKNPISGLPQYGGINAPGNAPWVLTVGAYSHEGTLTRTDDVMGRYSSHGPTAIDFGAKPDVVAPGTGIVSMSEPGSFLYNSNPLYLVAGSLITNKNRKPYLSLTGTSMAAPMVAGTAALMLQANPALTPNLVKAIIEYTAESRPYDPLTQGAGFLNTKGAVDIAKFLAAPQAGHVYPSNTAWSRTILWGNRRLSRGVIKPAGSAWALNTVWGAATDGEGDNIVWGTACSSDLCDNIVWGTAEMDADNIVWGTFDREGDNIVWGTADGEGDNIVWGTACGDGECDNIVWGTECGGSDCDNIVWGTAEMEGDNIVWGTACGDGECDNIVWGTASEGEGDNIVWGTSDALDEAPPLFDDPVIPPDLDFDSLFGGSEPETVLVPDAPLAVLPTTPLLDAPLTTVVGGGF